MATPPVLCSCQLCSILPVIVGGPFGVYSTFDIHYIVVSLDTIHQTDSHSEAERHEVRLPRTNPDCPRP